MRKRKGIPVGNKGGTPFRKTDYKNKTFTSSTFNLPFGIYLFKGNISINKDIIYKLKGISNLKRAEIPFIVIFPLD